MKRKLLGILALAWLSIATAAQTTKPLEQRHSETLAAGIEHLAIKRGDFTAEAGDHWQIHALLVNPEKATIRLARAMDEIVGAETTSSGAAEFLFVFDRRTASWAEH